MKRGLVLVCAIGCGGHVAEPPSPKPVKPIDVGFDTPTPTPVASSDEPPPSDVIVDAASKKTWTAKPSTELTWAEAQGYCSDVRAGGFTDWRLPTKDELASLIDPAPHPTSPDSHLLREPFRSLLPESGYVLSGELIMDGPDDPWIMNIRNARIFNGTGYSGYVFCVR